MKLYKYEVRDMDDNVYSDLVTANTPKEAMSKVREAYENDGNVGYNIDVVFVTEVSTIGRHRVILERMQ